MRARVVERCKGTATILLTPSWLGRLAGHKPYFLQCKQVEDTYRGGRVWVYATTLRPLPDHMLDTLDRDEIQPLPPAKTEADKRCKPAGPRWQVSETYERREL